MSADLRKKREKERDREEEIPELRVSLQLKNRGVSVPLQGPGGGGRGCHAGDRREKTCKINLSRNNTIIHTNINIIAHAIRQHAACKPGEQCERTNQINTGMQFKASCTYKILMFMHSPKDRW